MLIKFKVEGFKNFEKELVFDLSKTRNDNFSIFSTLSANLFCNSIGGTGSTIFSKSLLTRLGIVTALL